MLKRAGFEAIVEVDGEGSAATVVERLVGVRAAREGRGREAEELERIDSVFQKT